MENPVTPDAGDTVNLEVVFDGREYRAGEIHLAFKKLYEAVMEKPFPFRPAKLNRMSPPEAVIRHAAREMNDEDCSENV